MTSPMPEPTREETIAREAAAAALQSLPDYAGQLAEIRAAITDLDSRLSRRPADPWPALEELTERLDNLPAPADPWPALEELTERLDNLPAPVDQGPALETLTRALADLKLSILERSAR